MYTAILNLVGLNFLINTLKSVDTSPTSTLAFDMGYSYFRRHQSKHACGSACCIGGWCQFLFPNEEYVSLQEAFGRIVDDDELRTAVCYPNGIYLDDDVMLNPMKATVEQAITMLEILRDTGEVDWQTAMTAPTEMVW